MSFELGLQEMKAKLAGLGVYDLKGLVVGLSILNSEAGKFQGPSWRGVSMHDGAIVTKSMNVNGCDKSACGANRDKELGICRMAEITTRHSL